LDHPVVVDHVGREHPSIVCV